MDKLVSFLFILKDVAVSVGNWIETHSDIITATATVAIALFTLTLYCATRKLWKVSQEQSRDMKTSLAIAKESADAAKKSAEVAENAMVHSQRSYIFVQRFFRDMKPSHNMAIIYIVLENTGDTPVRNMICSFDYFAFPGEIPKDFDFPEKGPRQYGIIGRKATLNIRILMPLVVFEDAFNKKTRAFIYGWIDYDDVFPTTSRHRTEICYEIVVNDDRSFIYQIYGNYNGSDDECYRKPSPYTSPT